MLNGTWDPVLKGSAAVFLLLSLGSRMMLHANSHDLWLILFLLFAVAFAQIALRLLNGMFFKHVYTTPWNYENAWFRTKAYEAVLYRLLHVRVWKNRVPTNRPEEFDLSENSLEQILNTSCRSEVVHESNILLGLSTILLAWLTPNPGYFAFLFLLIALLGAAADSIFIIVQRFNRPRLLRLKARLG